MKNRNTLKNILFITQGDINTASTRFRVYSYIEKLTKKDIGVSILSLPKDKSIYKRIIFIFKIIILAPSFQAIFIQKLLLPHVILRMLISMNKHIIYDWDDAIFALPPSDIVKAGKVKKKRRSLNYTLSNSSLIICGNKFLEAYTKSFNENTAIIPTPVNSVTFEPHQKSDSPTINVGWIGRSENLTYLTQLKDSFTKLEDLYKNNIRFRIVCDKPLYIDNVNNIDNIEWTLADELTNINSFDIGIMPLDNTDWSRGKCAFKLLQYMAAGIPCVASPVGANTEVIRHGYNGLLANSSDDWVECIKSLIEDQSKRQFLAKNAAATIEQKYTANAVFVDFYSALMRASSP